MQTALLSDPDKPSVFGSTCHGDVLRFVHRALQQKDERRRAAIERLQQFPYRMSGRCTGRFVNLLQIPAPRFRRRRA